MQREQVQENNAGNNTQRPRRCETHEYRAADRTENDKIAYGTKCPGYAKYAEKDDEPDVQ